MVDKPSLVTVEHTINTQGEKLARVPNLDNLLSAFLVERIIHIVQVTETTVIIISSSHITLFFSHDFALILNDESSLLDVFKGDQPPHHKLFSLLSATN